MEEESGISTATGTMRIDDVGESTLLGAAAAGGADAKGLSPGEHVLSFMDAERFVEELRTFDCREIGTPAWMAQHTRLEKLNLQSHQCALANSDDFVLEALVSEVALRSRCRLRLEALVHLHQVGEGATRRLHLLRGGGRLLADGVPGAHHRLLLREALDLTVELLDDPLSLAHDAQVRLVHVIRAEEVLGVAARLRQHLDLLEQGCVLEVQLRDDLPDLDNVGRRLLLLQLHDQVLELVDTLGEALRVRNDRVDAYCLAGPACEGDEVLHLVLEADELVLRVLQLAEEVVVLEHERLLLVIGLADLLDEVLGGLPLVVGVRDGGEQLVGFEELPLVLVDDRLELLALPRRL